jgi:hypothetical protein
MEKLKNFCLIAGILLLLVGFRIFIGIRFVAAIPQGDDWSTVLWLQKWAEGIHDWRYIWERHNGQHLLVLYNLANLGQYLLNGYWSGTLDFLTASFIHVAYGAVVIFTFKDLLSAKDRGWVLAFIFFLFAVPFAGYRVGWGNNWGHSAMMLFSLAALYRTVNNGQKWINVIHIFFLAALASLNMGSGCIGALMVALFILFRTAVIRHITSRDVVLAGMAWGFHSRRRNLDLGSAHWTRDGLYSLFIIPLAECRIYYCRRGLDFHLVHGHGSFSRGKHQSGNAF